MGPPHRERNAPHQIAKHRAGTVSYPDLVVAQATALDNERTTVDIRSRRMVAAILLIKGLGGGWTAADLDGAK